MKKIVIVFGHHNTKNSFNSAIRDNFINEAKLHGHQIDVINLFEEKEQLPFYNSDFNPPPKIVLDYRKRLENSDIMFFVTCPEITPIFVPHRHPAPSPDWHAGALMLPLIGTDEQSITKYAHWHDPEDNRYIDSYNYIKGRPELSEIPDEEVAVEYCLHEKPAIFNRHQFHQVVNPTDHWRVVAHIPYDTESWDDCKKFALIK